MLPECKCHVLLLQQARREKLQRETTSFGSCSPDWHKKKADRRTCFSPGRSALDYRLIVLLLPNRTPEMNHRNFCNKILNGYSENNSVCKNSFYVTQFL